MTGSSSEQRPSWQRWVRASLLAVVPALLVLPFVLSRCSPSKCTPGSDDPSVPQVSIECQAGTLCYQGECVRTCNAGGELADECLEDSDCSEGRPFCTEGFCSSCEAPTRCIPQLDICAEVRIVDIDAGNSQGERPQARQPLDGGAFDVPIFVHEEPEPEVVDLPVTHTGTLTIAQINAPRAPITDSNQLYAQVRELEQATVVRGETVDARADGEVVCELIKKDLIQGQAPRVDIGDIKINGVGIRGEDFLLVFDEFLQDYVPVPATPTTESLLVYSTADHFREVTVTSEGTPLTGGLWPRVAQGRDHHVPFKLVPTPESQNVLRSGIRVTDPPSQILRLGWEAPKTALGEPISGTVPGVNLRVAIGQEPSLRYLLECTSTETPHEIVVPSPMLQRFRQLNSLTSSTTLPLKLSFERSFESRIPVRADYRSRVNIRMSIQIRDTWETDIRF